MPLLMAAEIVWRGNCMKLVRLYRRENAVRYALLSPCELPFHKQFIASQPLASPLRNLRVPQESIGAKI